MEISVETPVKPDVKITLTWDEAEKLRDILGLVSRADYAKFTYKSEMPEDYPEFMDSIYDCLVPVLEGGS
jgi:hypothetical protein